MMRAVLGFSLTLLIVFILRRAVREISNSFSAPYFLTSHFQTHSVHQSMRVFPRVAKRLSLEDAPLCRIPVVANLLHPSPSCAYFDLAALEDVSIDLLARRICPNCAARCGSSAELVALMDPPEGVVLYPFLYAFFTSQLFAHSYRPSHANPHAFGWLTLASEDAARRDPQLATLLEPLFAYLYPRRREVFNRVVPLYVGDDMTPSTILAPLTHMLGSVLGLVPSSFIADDIVVLPDGPRALAEKFSSSHNAVVPVYHLDGYRATSLVPPHAMRLFLSLVRTGIEPQDAAQAATSLTSVEPG